MVATDENIAALIDRIHDLPLQPESWTTVTGALERLTQGRVAVLAQSRRSVSFVKACGRAGQSDEIDYLDRYWTTDRAMSWLRGSPAGTAILDSRLVSDCERDRIAFYSEYLRPRELNRGCYAVLSHDGDQSLIVGVHRPDRSDELDDACLKILDHVRPHLARGLAIMRRLADERTARDTASAALAQVGWGMLLVTPEGRVRFASAGGEACLDDKVLRLRNGRVTAADIACARDFETAVAGAARATGGRTTLLTLPTRDGGAARLSVSPCRNAGDAASEPLALVLIEQGEAAPDEARLRHEYRLTPAEARLVRALAEGERLADYAERTGVRLTTAKTHLSSVFDKTGIRRQAELVRLALTDPTLRLSLSEPRPEHDWGGYRRTVAAE